MLCVDDGIGYVRNGGVAIARMLEEHAEITIFDLAKDKLSRALRHGR